MMHPNDLPRIQRDTREHYERQARDAANDRAENIAAVFLGGFVVFAILFSLVMP